MDKEKERNIFCPKGIWIPIEVLFNPELTPLERELFCFIDSLDSGKKHCFASNQYLARILSVTETKISLGITKLIKLQYISLVSFDGRQRVLKTNPKYLEKYQYIREEYIDLIKDSRENPFQNNNEENPKNLKGRLKQKLKADLNKSYSLHLTNVKDINNNSTKDNIEDKGNSLKKKIISKDIIQKENSLPNPFNSEEGKLLNKKPRNKSSNRTLSPEGFNLTEKMRVYALERNSALDTELEFEKFLSYHEAKGSKFSSWEAAWRTWILNQVKWNKNNGFKQKQTPQQPSLYPEASKEEQEIVLEQFNYWCREELDNSQKEYELDKLTTFEKSKLNQIIYLAKEVLKPGNIEKDSGEYGGSWEWKDPDKMITDRNGKKYFDDKQEKIWIENKEREYGAHKQDRFGYSIENVAQYLSRALNFLVTDQLELDSFSDKKVFLGHLCNRWVWEKVLLNYVKVTWGVNDFKINEVFFNNQFSKKEN